MNVCTLSFLAQEAPFDTRDVLVRKLVVVKYTGVKEASDWEMGKEGALVVVVVVVVTLVEMVSVMIAAVVDVSSGRQHRSHGDD